eukprot:3840764-Pyramimonas_sp.AAC.1
MMLTFFLAFYSAVHAHMVGKRGPESNAAHCRDTRAKAKAKALATSARGSRDLGSLFAASATAAAPNESEDAPAAGCEGGGGA